jgi:hypothetical protein
MEEGDEEGGGGKAAAVKLTTGKAIELASMADQLVLWVV